MGGRVGPRVPSRSTARYAETAAPNEIQFNGWRRIANLHQMYAHRRSTVTLIACSREARHEKAFRSLRHPLR